MKEQTFEELVEEIHYDITNSFRKDDILKLLKQVREATIKECTEILLNPDYGWSGQIELEFKKLPTDRIKIK